MSASEREQCLDEILARYLAAVADGAAPPRQELLDQHPDLAPELASFFADRDRFDLLASPLRGFVPGGEACAPPRDFADYEILEEIARGGMGVIYRARQKSLGRVVALKMLLVGPLASAADLQRFRGEAEAAAALDHPHIVPIYEVGSHEGRPFLSMKLIEGGSLARGSGDRSQDSGDSKEQQHRLAQLLRKVAEAVHHAHQRGVLHRDLKPANILIDSAGQPHVTDFGLAKRTGPRAVSPGTATPLPALTHTGAMLGTPAYMAPEQAAGERDRVTVATDVYGLGTILYELLTGQPPFRGETPLDTLKRVLEEEPARPQTLNPLTDRDLETICLKCLQKEPGKRYGSALELADDLRRFLAGEPILARPVGPVARAWRRVRRRPLVAGLLVALVATLTGGLGLSTWQWQRAERHAREEKHQRELAERALADAEDSFRLAHSAVNDFFLYVDQELVRAPGLQPLRRTLLKVARAYFENFRKRRRRDPALRVELADAHFNVARISAALGPRADARAAYQQALALYRELHRAAPGDLALRRRLAHTLCNLAMIEEIAAVKLSLFEEARTCYTAFLLDNPRDRELRSGLGNTLNNLGTVHVISGRLAEARRCLRRAAQLQEGLVREAPRESSYPAQLASALGNLGTLAARLGDHTEAVRCFGRVRELWDELARAAPGDPERQAGLAGACHNLAIALSNAGQRQEALPHLRRALALRTRLTDANPHVIRFQAELGACHTSLGVLHARERAFDKALGCYRAARAIHERLVRLDPGSAVFRKNLAASHFNVGVVHGARQQRTDELQAFEKARGLQEALLKSDPDNLDYRLDLARTLNNMGYNLWTTHHLDAARPVLHQAIATLRIAVARSPRMPAYRSQLSMHWELLAHVESAAGRPRAALAALRKRRDLWPDHAEELYRTACAVALLGERVGQGERRAYAELVVKTLRQAMKQGFHDAARLRKEAAFRSLHGRDDFQSILAELEEG